MYTLFDTQPIWPLNHSPDGQVYYGAMPGTTMMNNALPTVNQAPYQGVYYQVPPVWYAQTRPNIPMRPRLSSDDVFVPEGTFMYGLPAYNYQIASPKAQPSGPKNGPLSLPLKEVPYQGVCRSKEPRLNYQPVNSSLSPDSYKDKSEYSSSLDSSTNFRKIDNVLDSLSVSSHSNASSNNSNKHDDSITHPLLPTSLCIALNDDPPEPASVDTPLKTSSPIRRKSGGDPPLIDVTNFRKRRGRYITSSSSEKCPRFSENGVCDDLDQCDRIIIRSREQNAAEDAAKKREEFLLILEAERQRQKKLVLRKHAPKMSCKFCRNNGESSEVYTKHKLQHSEKTVCPLLRHYICRLCNSTGDFAHTIRHCPFNDRKDKIAWKATFLV